MSEAKRLLLTVFPHATCVRIRVALYEVQFGRSKARGFSASQAWKNALLKYLDRESKR